MHSTKSTAAIAIAANHSVNFSQPFSIPNNWERPKFAIGDRVQYVDRHCLMTCTVRGMEYFPERLPSYSESRWPVGGWSYYLLPDLNPTIRPHILEDAFTQPVDETEITSI